MKTKAARTSMLVVLTVMLVGASLLACDLSSLIGPVTPVVIVVTDTPVPPTQAPIVIVVTATPPPGAPTEPPPPPAVPTVTPGVIGLPPTLPPPTGAPTTTPPLPAAPTQTPVVIVVTATPPSPPPPTAATATPKPTAAPPAKPTGKVAYTVYRGPGRRDYSIYLMNADGSGAKEIIRQASEPSFSLNGKQLVYYDWAAGSLYIANADGSNAFRIVNDGQAEYPSWNPTNLAKIVYSSVLGGSQSNIYLLEATKVVGDTATFPEVGTGRQLGPGQRPSWSGDGTRIVYENCSGSSCGVWIMNADGGGPHAITADGGGQPVWSPTGDKIAYTASAGSLEIFIVNADGTDRKQLTNNANNDALPAWSPDGRFIFFRTDRDGKWSIYVMNADGSNQRWVIDAHVSPDRWQWEKISTTK